MPDSHFVDDNHAIAAGAFIGMLLQHDIKVEIQADGEGNYLDTVVVLIEDIDPSNAPWRVPITIGPPTT